MATEESTRLTVNLVVGLDAAKSEELIPREVSTSKEGIQSSVDWSIWNNGYKKSISE